MAIFPRLPKLGMHSSTAEVLVSDIALNLNKNKILQEIFNTSNILAITQFVHIPQKLKRELIVFLTSSYGILIICIILYQARAMLIACMYGAPRRHHISFIGKSIIGPSLYVILSTLHYSLSDTALLPLSKALPNRHGRV